MIASLQTVAEETEGIADRSNAVEDPAEGCLVAMPVGTDLHLRDAGAGEAHAVVQRDVPARAFALLSVALTAGLSLELSRQKLLWFDEIVCFQMDRLPSVADLLRDQRLYPVGIDPMLFHLLTHGAIQVFGQNAFADRFWSFLGFLLMQVCLFFLVGNLAGERAGAFAAAFPAMTASLFYSAEGRPYGLEIGLFALALLCWQVAARPSNPARRRRAALAGLAFAIAAAINTHYYAVLLLAPIGAAEVYRTVARRRIDWAVASAIALGAAGTLLVLPFAHGAMEFHQHFYILDKVPLRVIPDAYSTMLLGGAHLGPVLGWTGVAMLLVALALVVAGCRRQFHDNSSIQRPEWVLLLAMAALPFFGFVLARLVTHTIELRHVLGALIALAALAAIAIEPQLRDSARFTRVMGVVILAILLNGTLRIYVARTQRQNNSVALVLTPAEKSALLANPDGHLYIQNDGEFELASVYEPDPEVRKRLVFVYSQAEELRWNYHDTEAVTATHMQHFTDLTIVPYETLRSQPGDHLFVLRHTNWDWTDQALAADGAQVTVEGEALLGDFARVRFAATR